MFWHRKRATDDQDAPLSGYGTAREHLEDELSWVEHLIRAQVIRWRLMLARYKPTGHWGMLNVSEEEIEAFLASNFAPLGVDPVTSLPDPNNCGVEDWLARARRHVESAVRELGSIDQRLACTDRVPYSRLRLERLRRLHDLNDLERGSLLIALLPEVDSRYRRLFGYLQDDASRSRPSVELISEILAPLSPSEAVMRLVFDGSSPLIEQGLLLIGGHPDQDDSPPLSVRPVRLDDWTVAFLLHELPLNPTDHSIDDRLAEFSRFADGQVRWEDLEFEPERVDHLSAIAMRLSLRLESSAWNFEPPNIDGETPSAVGETPQVLINPRGQVEVDPDGAGPLPPRIATDDEVEDLIQTIAQEERESPRLEPAGGGEDCPRITRPHRARKVLVPAKAGTGATVLLHGQRGVGTLPVARAMTDETRLELLIIDVEPALRSPLDWTRLVMLAYREAAAHGVLIAWDHAGLLLEKDQPAHRWQVLVQAAERFPGVTFLLSQTGWDPIEGFRCAPFLHIELPAPHFERRVRLWMRHLPWICPAEHWPDVAEGRDSVVVTGLREAYHRDRLRTAHSADARSELARQVSTAHAKIYHCPERYRDELIQRWVVWYRLALARELANAFQLAGDQIAAAVAAARWQAVIRDPSTPRIVPDDLFDACRKVSGRKLASFARRIEPRPGINLGGLVLPDANRLQLQELIQRVRGREALYSGLGFEKRITLGRGVVALFMGPSGTGKTFAAELIASGENTDLYKVDLASVVSKWVGETEKHLAAIFAEAEDSNAVLLFDEAEALFSRRGEVKDAQDRWANMETNYLLQRIEEYSGVVILTTNLRQNIDDSFLRRIHVIVEFPFPTERERLAIWMGLFPPELRHPSEEEIRPLAKRFELAGGSISNIVVDAAIRALSRLEREGSRAGTRPEINRDDLVLSVAREYQKQGRPITRSEFGEEFLELANRELLLAPPGEPRTLLDYTRQEAAGPFAPLWGMNPR